MRPSQVHVQRREPTHLFPLRHAGLSSHPVHRLQTCSASVGPSCSGADSILIFRYAVYDTVFIPHTSCVLLPFFRIRIILLHRLSELDPAEFSDRTAFFRRIHCKRPQRAYSNGVTAGQLLASPEDSMPSGGSPLHAHSRPSGYEASRAVEPGSILISLLQGQHLEVCLPALAINMTVSVTYRIWLCLLQRLSVLLHRGQIRSERFPLISLLSQF